MGNELKQSFTICTAGNSDLEANPDLEGNPKGIFTDGTDVCSTLSDQARCQLPPALSTGAPPCHPALPMEPPSSTSLLDLTVASWPA